MERQESIYYQHLTPGGGNHQSLPGTPEISQSVLFSYPQQIPFSYSQPYPSSSKEAISMDDSNHSEQLQTATAAPPSRKSLSLWRRLQQWWWLELGAAALAAACMICTIAVLGALDGMLLEDWKFVVSPNAFLNIISTTARVAILFPIAECLSELKWAHFYQPRPHPLVHLQMFDDASRGPLGAAFFLWGIGFRRHTMLATLATVLMIAALALGSVTQQALEIKTRPVPRAGVATIMATRAYNSTDVENEQFKIDSAVYRGLFGADITPTFYCPSGNCEWKEIITFGFCGECNDVTSNTTFTCKRLDTGYNGVNCTLVLPSNETLEGYSKGDNKTSYAAKNLYYNNFTMPPPDARLSSFITAAFHDPDNDLRNTTVLECFTRLCVKVIRNISVKEGKFKNGDITEFPLTLFEVPEEYHGPFETMVRFNVSSSITEEFQGKSQVFELPGYMMNKLKTSVDFLFMGPRMELTLKDRTVERVVPDVARELTTLMQSCDITEKVYGITHEEKAYIKFRWAWAVPPIVLIFFGIALLVAVIIGGSKMRPRWKSSSLALLLHELKAPGMVDYHQVKSVPEMEQLAEEMIINAGRLEGGSYAFVAQPEPTESHVR